MTDMSSTLVSTNGEGSVNLNPFGRREKPSNASIEVESQRAIAEIQAAMVIAQRFPRDTPAAMDRILQAFTRQTLAEKALYTYARGGTDVTGPSIRAAEAIAQEWGNMQFGVRELEQRNGESTVEAYAWDVQTNTRNAKTFQVPHIRHTRKGQTRLEDPRDIYELVANQGARRLRACILGVVPSDVVEAAITQAETTLKTKIKITPELMQSLLDKFASIGVPRRALEAKIQRRIEAVTPALVVQLGKIFNAIEDGLGVVSDYFELDATEQTAADEVAKGRVDQLAEKLAKKKAEAEKAPAAEGATVPEEAPIAAAVEASGAAQINAESPAEAEPEVVDDKLKARDLRGAIGKAWKDVPEPSRRDLLTRLYGQKSLTDLNVTQLAELLEDLPEHLGGGA